MIQTELNAPKGQRNTFGNYNYRSCEDILEAVKPLLNKHECHVRISDDIVLIGSRYYVKATAELKKGDILLSSSNGYAREAETKKGMDESQITGAASSYARKYALNGLFAIDDEEDSDKTNKHGKEPPNQVPQPPKAPTAPQPPKVPTQENKSPKIEISTSGVVGEKIPKGTKKGDRTSSSNVIVVDGVKYYSVKKEHYEAIKTGYEIELKYTESEYQGKKYRYLVDYFVRENNIPSPPPDEEGLPF
jgi:hypothetical protein